jgi:hypothetical protein
VNRLDFEVFVPPIILDGNSQVCLHKLLIRATDRKIICAQRCARSLAWYLLGISTHHENTMKALFPEKLERLQYFIRWLIYLVSVAVIAAFLLPLPKFIGVPTWLPLIVIIPLILLRFPCLDIPRFRSMGWSPWLVLLFLVPLVNFIMQLLLFFVPPKQADA